MLVFGEWHQVHVVLAADDEDALPGVTAGVRVSQDVEQVATLDVEDNVLEPDAALRPELPVVRVLDDPEGLEGANPFPRREGCGSKLSPSVCARTNHFRRNTNRMKVPRRLSSWVARCSSGLRFAAIGMQSTTPSRRGERAVLSPASRGTSRIGPGVIPRSAHCTYARIWFPAL